METLESHFSQWGAVIFFAILYGSILFFMPFYRKINRKPAAAYLAFVIAFAVEMHGIPFSMYILSIFIGENLPNGVLWGHTLFDKIGYAGMYINIALSLSGLILIILGWYSVYHNYWKHVKGQGKVVCKGIYRYIRHPQYAGLMLISSGMLAEWATLPTLIMFPVIIYMYVKLAKKEEKDMISEFGEEYVQYMKKTKRFIPGIC